jgi:hypothetical protein
MDEDIFQMDEDICGEPIYPDAELLREREKLRYRKDYTFDYESDEKANYETRLKEWATEMLFVLMGQRRRWEEVLMWVDPDTRDRFATYLIEYSFCDEGSRVYAARQDMDIKSL